MGLPAEGEVVIWRDALAWLFGAAAIGCAGTAPTGPVSPSPQPRAALEQQQQAPTSGPGTGAVLSPCILHAGEINTDTTRWRGPVGQLGPTARKTACAYNAECVQRQGATSHGDGTVTLQCNGRACVCRIEAFGARPVKREFAFEAECATGEQAQRLLKERCIAAAARPD